MSHNYLFDTYAFIGQRLAAIQRQFGDTEDAQALEHSAAGRIEALRQFETFLTAHFDAKLPRRLARLRKKHHNPEIQ